MAVYDDFHGAYFTIQAALMYHQEISEIIVIDNNPTSSHGKSLKGLCDMLANRGVRYMPLVGVKGTAVTRDKIFGLATNDLVVCCDPHVLFVPEGFARLAEYFHDRPECKDLIQGPLIYDNLEQISTHFNLNVWRSEMWGIWDTDPRGHGKEPFEIPAQGLGAFACLKKSWLGFNPAFRGFGGEEGYIHEKFRKAGHKVICLPEFKWLHRFARPDGVPYPLTRLDKIRNYVLGHKELGLDLAPIHKHFVLGINTQGEGRPAKPLITESQWRYLSKGEYPPAEDVTVENIKPKCGSCNKQPVLSGGKMTLDEWYDISVNKASDINEHIPTLKKFAEESEKVVELTSRAGISTAGLLAGKPKEMVCYDSNHSAPAIELEKVSKETKFNFIQGNSLEIEIPECDLLFIDTKHTGEHVYNELNKHAAKVSQRIIFHDTEIYGERGEDGSAGLLAGIRRFLHENPEWFTIRHDQNNNGLTVISRDPKEAPPRLPPMWKMAVNYAKSEAKDVMQGRKRVPLEIAEQRYEVCKSNGGRCPVGMRLIDEDRCTKCGCYLHHQPGQAEDSQTGKIWRPLDSCPMGLWGPYNEE